MAGPISDAAEQAPRFRRAFESVLNEIRAVPDGDCVRISLNVTAAVTTVLGSLPKLRAFGPQIAAIWSPSCFPLARFDELELYALALGHAQTLYETVTEQPATVTATAIRTLAASAINWRHILMCDLKVLISRVLIDATVLKALRGGTAYQNVVDDLFALANILRNNWSTASVRTAVTIEELDHAESLAGQLQTAVGERQQALAIATEAARDRQAAFALFIGTYREIRTAIKYLRRKEGDVNAFAPSLYDGRSAGKQKRPGRASGRRSHFQEMSQLSKGRHRTTS